MTHSAHDSELLTYEGGPKPGTAGVRFGFFTDTSVCIGCKACEVACKEWNDVPPDPQGFTGHSMDNTGALGANTWRHVAFVEKGGMGPPATPQDTPGGSVGTGAADGHRADLSWFGEDPGLPAGAHGAAEAPQVPVFPGAPAGDGVADLSWLMSSDVCKHCTEPGCLEVCPTGAIVFTEFQTVLVQDDICNGCGYCVTACPYGVIERRGRDLPRGGGAHKCTLCYDRLRGGKQPACAMACPTDSIQFGPLDELRARAADRLDQVVAAGVPGAQLYGHSSDDGVGGNGAFFLLLDDPEVYGLPPDPVTPTRHIGEIWRAATVAGVALVGAVLAAFAAGRR